VTPGANFEFVNDGLVRANSPPAPAGVDEVKIILVFPGSSPPNREVGTFYYYTIDPSRGGEGQTVTIRGSGLKEVKAVKFGTKELAVPADANRVASVLSVQTPPHQDAGGVDDVDVTLIFPVDAPTNFFVVGKYHYGTT
jgi:IPT/TIG domain